MTQKRAQGQSVFPQSFRGYVTIQRSAVTPHTGVVYVNPNDDHHLRFVQPHRRYACIEIYFDKDIYDKQSWMQFKTVDEYNANGEE